MGKALHLDTTLQMEAHVATRHECTLRHTASTATHMQSVYVGVQWPDLISPSRTCDAYDAGIDLDEIGLVNSV